MKQNMKKAACILSALAALVLGVLIIARVFFGYDIFDRSGWREGEDGARYYLNYEGDPLLGWQEVEGATYYFSPERGGAMHTSWLDVAEGRFFLDDAGLKTTGWATLEGERYYFDDQGCMHTGWLEEGDSAYFLTDSGTMHIGWLDCDRGRFYFAEDGRMQTGWIETENGLCYLSETGAVTAGWVDTDQGRFYIDEDGSIHTGWLAVEDKTYFLSDSGVVHTGWLEQEGERYYFHADGSMAVGRVEIDGTARYFTSTGKYFVLVNPWNSVPSDYEPELVWFDGFQVDAACYDALGNMREACLAAGLPFDLTSAYRGVSYQTTLFQRKVDKLVAQGYTRSAAESETARSIAVPGTSEHHLGLAVDIKSGQGTYDWLARHSWEYGFIQRYPYGTTELTGIYYEPWHFRYVGKELAAELYDLGLCVEAYMDMLTEKAASGTAAE